MTFLQVRSAAVPAAAWVLAPVLAALPAAAGGCGNDGFDLGQATSTTGAGTAAGGSGGSGGQAAGGSGSGAGSSNGGAGGGIVEPPGPTTLTLVNGVVDYDAARFCLVPYPGGAGSEQPWPGSEGIAFASAAVETSITALVPAGQDVELVGLAGNLPAIAGASCAQILAQPPAGLQLWSFGVLPGSAFEQDRDLLLVTSGCMGGPGHSDVLQTLVCGTGYKPETPTATVVAGFMSRLREPDKVSMQFVQGARALQQTQLRVRPGQSAAVAQLVDSTWAWGAITPYPPYDTFSLQALGMVGNTRIELYVQNNPNPIADVPFAAAFFNSALATEQVQDGNGYVFVAVGPSPGIAQGPWWNGFKVTVVAANPGG